METVQLSLAPIHDDLPTFMSLPQDTAARYRPLSTALLCGLTRVEHCPAEAGRDVGELLGRHVGMDRGPRLTDGWRAASPSLSGPMNIDEWLRTLGLERYGPAFRDNEITPDLLPSLTADDLKDLGVTLIGHRRRLLDAIAS